MYRINQILAIPTTFWRWRPTMPKLGLEGGTRLEAAKKTVAVGPAPTLRTINCGRRVRLQLGV
jgi:hypothetical protein